MQPKFGSVPGEGGLINFPVFLSLDVEGYQLYPGKAGDHALKLDLTPGPWIVLGVNGLGKSTLLLMLKYVFSGPVRIRGAGFTGDRSDIQSSDSRLFAVRVGDGADIATVTAKARIGRGTLLVERRLRDLSLVSAIFSSNGHDNKINDESSYRVEMANAMGLGRFEDVLRTLESVTFFLESREPLLWNVAGQFEVFRALLSPKTSTAMRSAEAAIISADSSARNLNAALFRIIKKRDAERAKLEKSAETRAWLAKATADLEKAQIAEGELQRENEALREETEDLRLQVRLAELEADKYADAYEEIKYKRINQAFQGISTNEQYLLLKLLSEKVCPSCGKKAEDAVATLEKRLAAHECLICGSAADEEFNSTDFPSVEETQTAFEKLRSARERVHHLGENFKNRSEMLGDQETELEAIRTRVDATGREVKKWRSQLPLASANEAAREEDRIEALRREVMNFRQERQQAEDEISVLLEGLRESAQAIRTRLEKHFNNLAETFFAEKVRLVYAARRVSIGQQGQSFEFPAFEVEMTSGVTEANFIRRSTSQVSLSQREYLDIIFRMSLIETFSDGSGSLVVDGPEGSVDAVFAEKAGDLFADLAGRTQDTTIILACNVIDGAFIPHSLKNFNSVKERYSRVVNLLDLAVPTAALSQLKSDYEAAVDKIMQQEAT